MLANRTIQAAAGTSLYQILKSLRFRSLVSAYLLRTATTLTDQQTFTFNFWAKCGALGTTRPLYTCFNDSNNFFGFNFTSSDTLQIGVVVGGSTLISQTTVAVYRDPSAWYHINLRIDTTQAVAANRVILEVNGVVQAFTAGTNPSQNANVHNWATRRIGTNIGPTNFFDGYLAEFNFIQGLSLSSTSFGQTDPVSGVWSAKRYAGAYGTNGFYLDFNDITSVGALGYDKTKISRTFLTASTHSTTSATYTFTVPVYSSNIVVTMWGGGGGGGGGGSTFGNNGSAGSASTFLTLSAGGGGGGTGAWTANPTGVSGAGGTATGGDTNTNGNSIATSNGATTGAGAPNGGGNTVTATANAEHYNGTVPGGAATGGRWAGSGNPTGGAGGSGAYVQKTYGVGALTPGTVITVTVGGGGAGGASDADQGSVGAAGRVTVVVDGGTSGNDWIPTNISLTGDALYDSMLDVPLGGGGGERGNYAVLNRLDIGSSAVVGDCGLRFDTTGSAYRTVKATIAPGAGAFYFELWAGGGSAGDNCRVGLCSMSENIQTGILGQSATSYMYSSNGNQGNNSLGTGTGATWTAGDKIGVSCDGVTITYYKNGVTQGTQTIVGGWRDLTFAVTSYYDTEYVTFGQRPFAYTPPTGFKTLHTGNLPQAIIKKPNQYFAPVLYTGNGTTQVISNGVFQPDFVWTKSRTPTARHHALFDSVRGANQGLYSSLNYAEGTWSGQSFTSTGFTVDATYSGETNSNGDTYIAWQWRAGGAAVSNTAGSITSQVSANPSSGFSVVSFTSNASGNDTVGHGLGAVPKLILLKTRTGNVYNWAVYHASVTSASQFLRLNTIDATITSTTTWGALHTTTTIGITSGVASEPSQTAIAYVFAEIAGYSKIGSYTGNASTDGPFVFTGFKPKYIMFKRSDSTGDWIVQDTTRASYNPSDTNLYSNLNAVETVGGGYPVDILSNGFKIRNSATYMNASGGTYVFIAFAEVPFKYALAR